MRVAVPALLVEDPLVLGVGYGPTGPDANPRPPALANRGRIRRLDSDDGYFMAPEDPPRDRNDRRRDDVIVGLDVGQLQ